MEDTQLENLSASVLMARELSPNVVKRLMTLVESGSPDISVKAARALIAIMNIDRSKIW